jgi:hypothetical protein
MLMLASAAFDHPNRHWPANLRHVGTPIDDAGAASWVSAWPPSDARPLVVVSLSTLNQGQVPLLRRILLAVARIDARVLVTLGPALHASEFDVPENVKVARLVPHSAALLSGAYLKTPGFGRPRCDWRRRWPQMATLQNMSSKRSRPSYARHLPDKMVDIRTRLAMPA